MSFWNVLALLLTLTALFGYLNDRWLRQPTTTGIMLMALLFSLGLVGLHHLGFDLKVPGKALLEQVHFDTTLLHGMLGYLLFAGALQVDVSQLKNNAWVISVLATLGTMISTVLVGGIGYYALQWIGLPLPFLVCLLFGALISPTDPIAVLAVFKKLATPPDLGMQIAGESLFNDSIALTLFLLFSTVIFRKTDTSWLEVATVFSREAFGGVAVGTALGWGIFFLMRRVRDHTVVILLSLAAASGGFALARHLSVSAALAMVVAGLIVGHQGRHHALTFSGRDRLELFWKVVDEILNAVLFMLIGLEVLLISYRTEYLNAIIMFIPIVLIARSVSISLPWLLLHRHCRFDRGALPVLIWGGLRGALSVAMALSLPAGETRDVVVAITYGIVVFSILVQGTTIQPLLAWRAARVTGE